MENLQKIKPSKKHDSAQAESFIPETHDAEWESHLAELVRFHEQYAHVQVPKRYPPCPELPLWLAAQKTHLADLSRDQIRRLWELGVKFPGTHKHQLWLSQFFKLVEGRECYGNANDPRIWQQDHPLENWVRTQRLLRKHLIPFRRRLLVEIGFAWSRRVTSWEKYFQEWCDYVRESGTTCISLKENKNLLGLANWTRRQRMLQREGKLDVKKAWRLEKSGISWNPQPEQWESHFRKLKRFREIHGHCRVSEVEGRSNLARWCWQKARERQEGKVSAERVARLNALGFVWRTREDFTERMLERLKRYHAEYGHGRVLKTEDPILTSWIRHLRQLRRKGLLSAEQFQQVDGLFEWEPDEESFEKKLAMLKRFYATHGHSHVLRKEDPQLAGWIIGLRHRRKHGWLSDEHVQQLDGLINWNPRGK